MSRFVATGSEDPLLLLVSLTRGLLGDQTWAQEHIREGKVVASPQLLHSVLPHLSLLLAQDQGLAHVTVAIYLLQKLRSEDTFPTLVREVVACLTSSQDNASVRLQALATLYDSFESDNPLLYDVFSGILSYSKSSGSSHLVLPHLQHLQKMVTAWRGIASEQKAELYWQAYELASQPTLRTTLLLHTLENSDKEHIRVELCVLEIMKLTNAHQLLKVLQLPVVASLTSAVGALGRCISEGSVAHFLDFERSHTSFFQDQHIDKDKMMSFLRIFGMCELAEQSPTFTFAQAAERIQVATSEVDYWVVQAVSSGLLEARIDQGEEVVHVLNTHHRFSSSASTNSLLAAFTRWETQLAQVSA